MKKLMVFSIVLLLTGCVANPNTIGLGTIGGIGGGVLGSKFGKGSGKLLTTTGGTLLGGLIGSYVGNQFDTINTNRNQINQNTIGLNRLSQTPTVILPSPTHHHSPSHHQNPYQVPMSCRVINNYVRCNGG